MPSALVATSALTRPVASALLEREPLGRLGLTGVRRDVVAAGAEVVGDLLRRGDGQAVDDAGPRLLGEVVGQPGQALLGSGQPDDAEPERLAVERPAQHERVARPVGGASCSATSALTRAFAVAVVASTGMPAGSSASRVRMRR